MNRMDVCTPRKGNDGKTRWLKIGAAFPSKSGPGWNLIFDALPLPDAEGRCAVSLFEVKPRDDNGGQRQGNDRGYGGDQSGYGAGGRPGGGYDGDSIPFRACWEV